MWLVRPGEYIGNKKHAWEKQQQQQQKKNWLTLNFWLTVVIKGHVLTWRNIKTDQSTVTVFTGKIASTTPFLLPYMARGGL